jgi:hypothetical protein
LCAALSRAPSTPVEAEFPFYLWCGSEAEALATLSGL